MTGLLNFRYFGNRLFPVLIPVVIGLSSAAAQAPENLAPLPAVSTASVAALEAKPGVESATLAFATSTNSPNAYSATCTAPGKPARTASGTASPLTVRGLAGGVEYACTVDAESTLKAGSANSQPVRVTPRRGNIATILSLLLDQDTGATPPPANAPPIMGNVPNQNITVGIAMTPISLASYVNATNGDPIIGYAIASGALPAGITLDATSGAISGTATTPGTYTVTVTASDKDGASNADSITFAVSGAAAATPPVMGNVPDQSATLGTAITDIALETYVTPTNGDPVTSYNIATGTLPPGLEFNVLTGTISGIPTTTGVFNITVTANDKDGTSNADAIRFAIGTPAGPIPPIMTPLPEQRGTINQPILPLALGGYVVTTNGDPITGYSLVGGELPPGLTLDTSTGEISGTPQVPADPLLSSSGYGALVAALDQDGASNSVLVWFSITDPARRIATDMSNVPASMTLEERMAALDQVSAFIAANWDSLELDPSKALLISHIQSHTDYADAGITSEGDVWARFKDSRPTAFQFERPTRPLVMAAGSAATRSSLMTDFAVGGAGMADAAATSKCPPDSSPMAICAGNMPKGKQAVLVDIDDLGLRFIDTLDSWLIGAGYTVRKPPQSIPDLMKAFYNTAILHFSSHGVYMVKSDGTQDSFWLNTSRVVPSVQEPDPQLRKMYQSFYDTGYLTTAPYSKKDAQGNVVTFKYWMLGEKFILDFFNLAEDSLIYIDACQMYLNPPASAAFRNALATKSKGKTNILGYDDTVWNAGSVQMASLFYDRLLGRNAVAPVSSPPQRPWSVSDVYYGMANLGKITDPIPGGTARLQLESKGGESVQLNGLKPSIQYASVHPPGSNISGIVNSPGWILGLFGYFGNEAGTVTLNDSPLTLARAWVHSSGTQNLYLNMPAGASGNVVVDVQGHRSNSVPLTQWNGTVSQSFIDPSIGSGAQVDIVCSFRATDDVHFRRSVMEGGQVTTGISANLDTTAACPYTMSGTWSDGTTYDYRLEGSGAVQPTKQGSNGGLYGRISSGSTTSLPINANAAWTLGLTVTGTLTRTHIRDLTVTTSPVSSRWMNADDHAVRLGADYLITKPSNSCVNTYAPSSCTETWNLVPSNAPTSTTPG